MKSWLIALALISSLSCIKRVSTNSQSRKLASASDIICRGDEGFKPELSKELNQPNIEVQCYWSDFSGKKKLLYNRDLDNKASITILRSYETQTSYKDKVIEGETRALKWWGEPERILRKYDIKTGRKLALEIARDESWPIGFNWEEVVDYEVDEDRKLLPLKTHDGLDFYSYFYEPTGRRKNCNGAEVNDGKKKVIVLVQGGTGSYKHEVEKDDAMDFATADFLRSQGYFVLLVNVRGKKGLSNQFRLTGIGELYRSGVKDILSSLDGLSKIYDIDKEDIRLAGCSRGGHTVALAATNLSSYSDEYKITKTIVSSGILDTAQGSLNYYQKLPENFSSLNYDEARSYLSFYDTDWMGGAVCPERPMGVFSDAEWVKINEIDLTYAKKYLERYPNLQQEPLCRKKTYELNSPVNHIDKLQGELLALAGYDESGDTSVFAPLNFKARDTKKNSYAIVHPFGHCIGPSEKGWGLKKRIFSEFFNGCTSGYDQDSTAQITKQIKSSYKCIIDKRPVNGIIDRNFKGVEELSLLLSTYEKDFLDCSVAVNTQQCLWQVHMNFLSLLEGHRAKAEDNELFSHCLEDFK